MFRKCSGTESCSGNFPGNELSPRSRRAPAFWTRSRRQTTRRRRPKPPRLRLRTATKTATSRGPWRRPTLSSPCCRSSNLRNWMPSCTRPSTRARRRHSQPFDFFHTPLSPSPTPTAIVFESPSTGRFIHPHHPSKPTQKKR